MNANVLFILSGLFSSAAPLTFLMEDIHICNSVCLRYVDVDDQNLCVPVKCQIFKTQNIQKYLNSRSMACKVSILY